MIPPPAPSGGRPPGPGQPAAGVPGRREEASTVPEHRQEFQRELEAIEAKLIEMFAMVAEDLAEATRALVSDDVQVAELLAQRGEVMDALYPEIEQLASREIALQAPVASDLRFLLSVLLIVPELERSHHLVVHIAYRGQRIPSEDLSPRCRELVEREGKLASAMWREAADSWYQRDRSAVVALGKRDDEMNEL